MVDTDVTLGILFQDFGSCSDTDHVAKIRGQRSDQASQTETRKGWSQWMNLMPLPRGSQKTLRTDWFDCLANLGAQLGVTVSLPDSFAAPSSCSQGTCYVATGTLQRRTWQNLKGSASSSPAYAPPISGSDSKRRRCELRQWDPDQWAGIGWVCKGFHDDFAPLAQCVSR